MVETLVLAARWWFSRLVACFPADFRDTVGSDLLDLLTDQAREAIVRHGRFRFVGYVCRATGFLLRDATLERRRDALRRRSPGPRPKEGMMAIWMDDLRHAWLSLKSRPGFVALAAMTLAVGLGTSVTMFSVFDGVLLRPLPYPESERLVRFGGRMGDRLDFDSLPVPGFETLARRQEVFSAVGAVTATSVVLLGEGEPKRLRGAAASASFLPLLGVRPALGPGFSSTDDRVGAPPVVVLSHGFWQRHGGDAAMIGSTVDLNGAPHQVVGILPSGFEPPVGALGREPIDVWVPLSSSDAYNREAGSFSLAVIARLRPSVRLSAARLEAAAAASEFAAEHADAVATWNVDFVDFSVIPLHEATVGKIKSALHALAGAVAFLLLTACVNVGHLFLVRAVDRQREMALRSALGAGRARVGRQLLFEGLAVAGVGGVGGLILAFGGVRLFRAFGPAELPRLDAIAVDQRALVFALVTTTLTGLLFGLAPVLAGTVHVPRSVLASGSATDTRRSSRLRTGLLVVQLGLAALLAIGAGLLIDSLAGIYRADPGFEPGAVQAMSLRLEGVEESEDRLLSFVENLERGLVSLPGIRSVGVSRMLPASDGSTWGSVQIRGDEPGAERLFVRQNPVTPGFFRVLDVATLAGRTIDETDRDSSAPIAVVNRHFARQYLGGEMSAIGRRIHVGDAEAPWRTVVGVVETLRQRGLHRTGEAEVFLPLTERPSGRLQVAVRGDLAPEATAALMRQAVWSLRPGLPVDNMRLIADDLASTIGGPRFYTSLFAGFSLVAILLAAVGIFGAMSHLVLRRLREIGIRIALGASSREIMRLVLRKGMAVTAAGLLSGVIAARMLTRFLGALVYGVEPLDAVTFATAVGILSAVAFAACWLPARRAAGVDPIRSLRSE